MRSKIKLFAMIAIFSSCSTNQSLIQDRLPAAATEDCFANIEKILISENISYENLINSLKNSSINRRTAIENALVDLVEISQQTRSALEKMFSKCREYMKIKKMVS